VGREWCRLDYPDHLLGDKDFVKKVWNFGQSSFVVTALERNPVWQSDFWLMKEIITAHGVIFTHFLSRCAELYARMTRMAHVTAIRKSKRQQCAQPSALLAHEFDFGSLGVPSRYTLAILLERCDCAGHLYDATSQHEFAREKPRKHSRSHQR